VEPRARLEPFLEPHVSPRYEARRPCQYGTQLGSWRAPVLVDRRADRPSPGTTSPDCRVLSASRQCKPIRLLWRRSAQARLLRGSVVGTRPLPCRTPGRAALRWAPTAEAP
jgi:hypothetical protein